ncbi:isovaleryl-CoA dehydrogenase [Parapusillimonas sp. JC17]|uniref:isovaleryl-CoA dehydrogenase n=1 Tax=Parapusillimonas sp. JC17 TaxID=3445768 RepID=UPI003F9FE449
MAWTTHEVVNQTPELSDYNLYSTDAAVQEGVARLAGQHETGLRHYGERLGMRASFSLAGDADRCPPRLETHDPQGNRVDRVHFHPAWHRFMRMAFLQGMHSGPWATPGNGAHVARAAAYLMHGQVEAGSLCPTTMTFAAIPVLARQPWFDSIAPLLYSTQYDERDLPLAEKTSMMVGMGLTEKQGGSDLRGNLTLAEPVAAHDGVYRLRGHKWFFSSPSSDAHLVLARSAAGLSCFYVPRWLEDGVQNAIVVMRLKDKLGNRSNASAEVEFQDASGLLVGEEGRGLPILLEVASCTRLDCVLGSAALLRQALVRAMHHARHRIAFGQTLIRQPLMQSVLMDLCLESEAATQLALRLAQACDGADDATEQAFRRILTPAAKFWVCKRCVEAIAECMEILGGNGYIEEGPLARLYREAPVNSIWEGSGNVMCLDVLRAIRREPESAALLFDKLEADCAQDGVLQPRLQALRVLLGGTSVDLEAAARHVAQEIVLLVQAVLMRRHAPATLADAFVQSRFNGGGRVYGLVATPNALDSMFERAWPEEG